MKKYFLALMILCCISYGCQTASVKRVDVDETIDFSGRWNDSDSRLTSDRIIFDVLGRTWIDKFVAEAGRDPVVIVGDFKNRTEEHINIDVFIKDLERALINSGKVVFVASKNERLGVRGERVAQNTEGQTRPETITPMGEETGADFMLTGSINTIKDETKGRYVILYQVNAELIDMRTNEKVFIGQNVLKKVVKKSKYSL